MAKHKRVWNDIEVETIVSRLLKVGITLASVFVLTGGVLYLIKYGADRPHYRVFSGEPSALRDLQGIITEAISLHSRGLIQLGLLVLMATPAIWVAFLFFAFKRQKDHVYVVVTLIVLATLLFSLAGTYLQG